MKLNSSLTFAIFVIFLSSCTPSMKSVKSYMPNTPYTTYVGSSMIWEEEGVKSYNHYQGFRQELLYSGIEGKILKLEYREYNVENGITLIKDAYKQNLSYDISDSDTIRFRQTKIKVLNANSSEIKFIVLSEGEDDIPSFNMVKDYPESIHVSDNKQRACAEMFLYELNKGTYVVPSKDAYNKYKECVNIKR